MPRSARMTDGDARRLLLHVLTDRALARGRGETDVVAAAIAGGATAIQLRGKELDRAELLRVGHELRALTRASGVLFVVNDSVDIALLVDADGAHVGQDDMPAPDARRLLGPDRLLGVSARTVAEAVRAEREGADYIGFGPVFMTATKADAGGALGLDELRRTRAAVTCPIVAIGGITAANSAQVADAGAAGVAVIAAVVAAPDPAAATREIRAALERAGRCDTRGGDT